MNIIATAISLTVEDVPASSNFLVDHFGFHEKMQADGFSSLTRDDTALNVIFLRKGIEVLPEGFRDQHTAGVIIAFTVNNLEAEQSRLQNEGVEITMPLREESWGERLFQVTDPNGVVIELLEWIEPADQTQ